MQHKNVPEYVHDTQNCVSVATQRENVTFSSVGITIDTIQIQMYSFIHSLNRSFNCSFTRSFKKS